MFLFLIFIVHYVCNAYANCWWIWSLSLQSDTILECHNFFWNASYDEFWQRLSLHQCHTLASHNVVHVAENYLLALCEEDRVKGFVRLLHTVDITKISSMNCVTNIFKFLGKLQLESFAKKFLQELVTIGKLVSFLLFRGAYIVGSFFNSLASC